MNPRILLISSKTEHIAAVCSALSTSGSSVSQAENISDAKAGLMLHSPAFLILDADMKGSRCFLSELYKEFYQFLPFIMVAGTISNDTDRVVFLNLGADAYIGKPINVEEILAIMNAVSRRERRAARLDFGRLLPRFEHKELVIDPLRRTVEMRKCPVGLTAKEFDILYLLAYRAGDVLTKEEIYKSVWNAEYNYTTTNVSDHISSIRRKLKLDKKDRNYIQTVFGVGYRFADIR